jgi:hypothetical protein
MNPTAVCLRHPDQPIAFTCARCGSFACEHCRGGPQGDLCEACVARARAEARFWPAARQALSLAVRTAPGLLPLLALQVGFRAVVGVCTELWRGAMHQPEVAQPGLKWALGLGVVALTTLASAGAEGLIGAVIDGIKIPRFAAVLDGEQRSLSDLLADLAQRYLTLATLLVLVDVVLGLLSLACCIPAVLLGGLVSFSEQEVLLARRGLWASLVGSYELARRAYWRLCLVCLGQFMAVALFSVAASAVARAMRLEGTWRLAVHALLFSCASTALAFVLDAWMTVLYKGCSRAQI